MMCCTAGGGTLANPGPYEVQIWQQGPHTIPTEVTTSANLEKPFAPYQFDPAAVMLSLPALPASGPDAFDCEDHANLPKGWLTARECEGLVSVYEHLGGATGSWGTSTGWLVPGTNPCMWTGVRRDSAWHRGLTTSQGAVAHR